MWRASPTSLARSVSDQCDDSISIYFRATFLEFAGSLLVRVSSGKEPQHAFCTDFFFEEGE